jgi:hypothetical protein
MILASRFCVLSGFAIRLSLINATIFSMDQTTQCLPPSQRLMVVSQLDSFSMSAKAARIRLSRR